MKNNHKKKRLDKEQSTLVDLFEFREDLQLSSEDYDEVVKDIKNGRYRKI